MSLIFPCKCLLFVVPRSSVGIFSNITNHDACDVLHALDALLALSTRRKTNEILLERAKHDLGRRLVGWWRTDGKVSFFYESR
jgi:hypothetical protein